jgi:hypothetical protein
MNDGVRARYARRQPVANRSKQLVIPCGAYGVVDMIEAIYVDAQNG